MSTFNHKLSTILESIPDQLKQALFKKVKAVLGPLPEGIALAPIGYPTRGMGRAARYHFAKIERPGARPIVLAYNDHQIEVSRLGAFSTWGELRTALRDAITRLSQRRIARRTVNQLQLRQEIKTFLDDRWNQPRPGLQLSADDFHPAPGRTNHHYIITAPAFRAYAGGYQQVILVLTAEELIVWKVHPEWVVQFNQFSNLLNVLNQNEVPPFDPVPNEGAAVPEDRQPWVLPSYLALNTHRGALARSAQDWQMLRAALTDHNLIDPAPEPPEELLNRARQAHGQQQEAETRSRDEQRVILAQRAAQFQAWAFKLHLDVKLYRLTWAHDRAHGDYTPAYDGLLNTDYGPVGVRITRQDDNTAKVSWQLKASLLVPSETGSFLTTDLSADYLTQVIDQHFA